MFVRDSSWLVFLSKGIHGQSESVVHIFFLFIKVHIDPTVNLTQGKLISFEGDVV